MNAMELIRSVGTVGEIQQLAVKGDRLAIRPVGPACSPRAWPYYDRDCLFESRWQGEGEGRKVRFVSTDKIDGQAR